MQLFVQFQIPSSFYLHSSSALALALTRRRYWRRSACVSYVKRVEARFVRDWVYVAAREQFEPKIHIGKLITVGIDAVGINGGLN